MTSGRCGVIIGLRHVCFDILTPCSAVLSLTKMMRTATVCLLASSLVALPSDFRIEARLVLMPAAVTDPCGSLFNGLSQQAFTVIEAQQTQPIISFYEADFRCPSRVALDLSASMAPHLAKSKRILRQLLDRTEPRDEALLIGIGDRATVRKPLTDAAAAGDTAPYDAVATGVAQMKNAKNSRRALIVISDGVDDTSRFSRGELLRLATEAEVEVHTLVLEVRAGKRSPVNIGESQDGMAFLGELSKVTGGLSFLIRDDAGMAAAAEKVGRALHTQDMIGHRPIGEPDGKHHSMKIEVAVPGTQVHWRRAYLSDQGTCAGTRCAYALLFLSSNTIWLQYRVRVSYDGNYWPCRGRSWA